MAAEHLEYRLLHSQWTVDLERQPAEEHGACRIALEPTRTPYLISLSILVLKEFDKFESHQDKVIPFVCSVLGVQMQKVRNIATRKYRGKKMIKITVDFRGPFVLEKQCGFFTATHTREYTSHTEQVNFSCRLEQPRIDEYLSKEDYNTYMTARYGT